MTQVVIIIETSQDGENIQLDQVMHVRNYDLLNAEEFKPHHVTDGFLHGVESSREKATSAIIEGMDSLGQQFIDNNFEPVKINIVDNTGFTLIVTVIKVNPHV
ncbi:gp46 [Listeria phage P35]|uniref:Uncharacterized protein n=1 Tax=Listeria phage LP-083-1 TaxID=1458854 RepID=A0A059T6Q0_9CAUD|nr:gp46 [Listeria phage P35]AAY53231.1 gp46 [Listeria phage P35]AHL19012.1 hypothetical protein LP083-1_047 [Listeria phage LP-083-1]